MFRNFGLSDFILVFFVLCLGICLIICVSSSCLDMVEKDCVEFYEEHNGYILKSCKKYSDNFGDLINVDV